MKIRDLGIERDDHLVGVKTYSNNSGRYYPDFPDFVKKFNKPYFDQAEVFKWEVVHYTDDNSYYMEILIYSRKEGMLVMARIQSVTDDDVPAILAFLKPHHEKFKEQWTPISRPLSAT